MPVPAPVVRNRWASALGGVFFGLFIAAAGAVFFALMWRAFERARAMEHWQRVPCLILESRIEEKVELPNAPVSYLPLVRYRFDLDGRPHESTRLRWGETKSTRPGRMEKLLAPFPPGAETVCYQNPADATDTVLIPEKRTPVYSIWFPGLFVVGGLGLAISAIFRNLRPGSRRSAAAP